MQKDSVQKNLFLILPVKKIDSFNNQKDRGFFKPYLLGLLVMP